MSQEIAASDELARQQRRADEAIFLEVLLEGWRNWRQGRTREEAEAKAAWLLENGAPICGAVAQRDLDRESRGGPIITLN
jgi:hypothetical protein